MKNNALSYHLAFALLQLIRNADGAINQRLNLTLLIEGCVKAMNPKAKGLDEVDDLLKFLRESYEPEMDLSAYAYSKGIAFEIELDGAQAALLEVINEANLVSPSVMQEIIAGRFSDDKKQPSQGMGKKVY